MTDELQAWVEDARAGVRARATAAQRPSFDGVMRRIAERSRGDNTEDALTSLVDHSRQAVDRAVESASRGATFGDVMTRAHQMAPAVVDAAKVAEAHALAPVVSIHRRGAAGLDEFLGDARGGVEAVVQQRRMQPIGGAPLPTVAQERRPKVGRWVAAGLLAAACLVGAVMLAAPNVLEPRMPDEPAQAMLVEERETAEGTAVPARPDVAPPRKSRADEPRAQEPVVEPDVVEEPERAPARARPSKAERRQALAELAALAETQWRAGRLAEAEKTLRQIVRRGGTSRFADNAFSDLFALAHRRGDAGARKRWWRAYLGRFPRGRFADDAAAGLCRSSGARGQDACWTRYLERFPSGSYRAEAARALKAR